MRSCFLPLLVNRGGRVMGMEVGTEKIPGPWIAYNAPRMASPMRRYFPIGFVASSSSGEELCSGERTRPKILKGRMRIISTIVPSILPNTKNRPERRLTSKPRKFIQVFIARWTMRPKKAPMEKGTEWLGLGMGDGVPSRAWASFFSFTSSSSSSTSGMECSPCSASSRVTSPRWLGCC